MRHKIDGRKLGRTTSHRMAMLRNMVTSLLTLERIQTTDAKAKELRRLADKMITLAKRGDLHARRQASSILRSRQVTRKLFTELADRYQKVNGGYSRVIKLGTRRGDGAGISMIELVTPMKATPARKKGPARKHAKKKAARVPSKARAKASPETAKSTSRAKISKTTSKAASREPTDVSKKALSKESAGVPSKTSAGKSAKSSAGKSATKTSSKKKGASEGK